MFGVTNDITGSPGAILISAKQTTETKNNKGIV
jgi:hypothetical protein